MNSNEATATTIDPRARFPHFYGNLVVQALASAKRWTISGRLTNKDTDELRDRKAPIDARHLIDTNRVRGAWATDQQCLVTLSELTERIPAAANAAFFLQASTDGLMIIDIEPKCPEEVARNLLALPGAIYTEISMSGNGYHLAIQPPANHRDFKIALGKKVLKHEQGWFEILIEHWVTFTRNPIEGDIMARAFEVDLGTAEYSTFEDVYESLAKNVKPARSPLIQIGDLGCGQPKIPAMDRIIPRMISGAQSRLKSVEDFSGDHSRFEFSTLGVLHRQMQFILSDVMLLAHEMGEPDVNYSQEDETWLLFLAAQEVLPPRAKHNEVRNGRPFLLDRAAVMVSLSSAPTN